MALGYVDQEADWSSMRGHESVSHDRELAIIQGELRASWQGLVQADADGENAEFMKNLSVTVHSVFGIINNLDSRMNAMAAKFMDQQMSRPHSWKNRITESKNAQNLKTFSGVKREEFKEWNDKLIKSFSVIYAGSRDLFQWLNMRLNTLRKQETHESIKKLRPR